MKNGNFYLSILFIFLSFLIFIFFISPKQTSVFQTRDFAKQKELEIVEFNNYVQELKEYLERIKNYPEQISKIENALPEDPEIFRFFNFIQKTASDSGIFLTKIGNISKSGKETKEWNIEFTLFGDYFSFKKFLSKIEKSSRMINLRKISFSPTEKDFTFDLIVQIKSK